VNVLKKFRDGLFHDESLRAEKQVAEIDKKVVVIGLHQNGIILVEGVKWRDRNSKSGQECDE
jgi:hypothetical protein